MLNWRYHLLTLIAVFLAMALGVLIGIGLSDSGVVETGRASIVDDIEQQLEVLSGQNDELNHQLSINQRYQEDTFPFLVRGRLQGKTLALIATSGVDDSILREIGSTINSAGAQILTTTITNPHMETGSVMDQIKTAPILDPALVSLDESTITAALGQELASDITRSGGADLLASLQGTLVESTSGAYNTPVDAVIYLTNQDNETSPGYSDWEKEFLLSLRRLGIKVAGGEPADAELSTIPLFINVDVSSVDNIDARIGQLSLVYIIAGERGSYGVKPTADLLIPILRTGGT